MINHLEPEMTRLPEPVPPATLVTTVMARVSRLAEQPAPASLASRASVGTARHERARRSSDLPAWVAGLAGLAIVFVSWIGSLNEADLAAGLISSRIGPPDLLHVSLNGSAALGLALGLLLYLAGLFAPYRLGRTYVRR